MSSQHNDISRLLPMLDAAFQVEQMRMAKIATRIKDLQKQLADLESAATFDPMSAAAIGGADILWQTWVQDRKGLISKEIALAARDREAARTDMVAALSKLEAARQMQKRAQSSARQIAARRTDW